MGADNNADNNADCKQCWHSWELTAMLTTMGVNNNADWLQCWQIWEVTTMLTTTWVKPERRFNKIKMTWQHRLGRGLWLKHGATAQHSWEKLRKLAWYSIYLSITVSYMMRRYERRFVGSIGVNKLWVLQTYSHSKLLSPDAVNDIRAAIISAFIKFVKSDL